jgi:myo-inositol-1(or 4)-monophosphatase
MSAEAEFAALEGAALAGFRAGSEIAKRDGGDRADWASFGLRSLLEACRELREHSAGFASQILQKADGSPATLLEAQVEEALQRRLAAFEPSATFVGEELGGPPPAAGWSVAMDPIDGTWAFLNETSTWSCTLAVFRDGRPFAGFVANPATGEIAYAVEGGPARFLRVSTFGESDFAMNLGGRPSPARRPLVNLHPNRAGSAVHAALLEAWQRDEVSSVRSPGGSPAWSLLEAARGHYVYVNIWSERPAQPFDLAAAALLLRCAGGDVTDLDNRSIDSATHAGPWVAGLSAESRERVAAIVKGAWHR